MFSSLFSIGISDANGHTFYHTGPPPEYSGGVCILFRDMS